MDCRPPSDRAWRTGSLVLATVLSLLFGVTFVAVTALTIGAWLTDPAYAETTPVGDLSFFALGGLLIAVGFTAQVRRERPLAGVQQAAIGLIALTLAGLLGNRVEPLVAGLLGLGLTAILAALHASRREFLRPGKCLSRPLAAMSLLAATPAAMYAVHMLALARAAGPSRFMGQCVAGDRLAEMDATAIAVVLTAALAAL